MHICRFRIILQDDHSFGKIGFDTAENAPLKVDGSLTYLPRNSNLSKVFWDTRWNRWDGEIDVLTRKPTVLFFPPFLPDANRSEYEVRVRAANLAGLGPWTTSTVDLSNGFKNRHLDPLLDKVKSSLGLFPK